MSVLVRSRLRRRTVRLSVLARLAQKVLEAVGESKAELSVEVVGDGRIRRLNREYRRKDRPTDVLAFPLRHVPRLPSRLLGDVVISLPTATHQAASLGHPLDEELIRLMIHGVLHLVGYDHERGTKEARRMHRKEDMILQSLKPFPKLVRN